MTVDHAARPRRDDGAPATRGGARRGAGRREAGTGRPARPAPRRADVAAADPGRSPRALASTASPPPHAGLEAAVNTTDRDDAPDACIAEAARFVADQPGGIDRILHLHQRRPDGSCTHHAHTPTPWPCSAVIIAHAAQQFTDRATAARTADLQDWAVSA